MRKMFCLGFIFLPIAFAQRDGGLPPVRPIPPVASPGAGFRPAPRGAFGRSFAPYAYPPYFGDYDYPYPYAGYAPAPSVVIVQQPPPVVMVPQSPPEPARLEIHEYAPSTPSPSPAPAEESAAFRIVMKDGLVRTAVAVAVQNNLGYLVDSDGRHERISLDAVDRDTTRRLNRERNLELQLPPPDR